MRVLLVGHGGREAALAWKIAQSPTLSHLMVIGENPSFPESAEYLPARTVDEIVEVAHTAQADLVVVGPEDPLAKGLADLLIEREIPVFGPQRDAARLEASKTFAKEVMVAAGVPTGGYVEVDCLDSESVRQARLRCDQGSVVIKADGLAAGKGVFVCQTAVEAHEALDELLSDRFGDAAQHLLLEELLEGPEVSVFGLSDGVRVVGLPSAQDHKRLGDGNVGPNTGGMGAYAPCGLMDAAEVNEVISRVHVPVIEEMARLGTPFRGVLYAGLMLTAAGPKVLEFNVRFGDPECQPLMCLWKDDILPWLYGVATGDLPQGAPVFRESYACCVVLASAGYPRTSDKGTPIPEPSASPNVQVFCAGATRDSGGVLRTSGGRVLGITGMGETLKEAREKAYESLPGWRFEGVQYRHDIAKSG